MGVAPHVVGFEPNLLKQGGNPLGAAAGGADAVGEKPLGNDVANPHPRVQRSHRVLEDDLHAPPHGAHPRSIELPEDFPVEDHAARRWLNQAQNGAAEGGLAGARLANKPHDGPLGNIETHILNGVHGPPVAGEDFGHSLDRHQGH